MPARREAVFLLVAASALAGCAPRPLLERAVRARGGALRGLVRTAEADVALGFPGTWQWRTAYLAPDRYAWSITTLAGVDHYLFDGAAARAFVGGREVATDAAASAPLRTQARFVAVTNLDAASGIGTVTPLPTADLPPGVAAGVAIAAADGARYRLGFDDRALLVWATGPVDLPQMGGGELVARYDDYRRVRGFWLPFRTTWTVGARRLAVERTLAACPNDPALVPAAFERPALLPRCEGS